MQNIRIVLHKNCNDLVFIECSLLKLMRAHPARCIVYEKNSGMKSTEDGISG